LLTPPIAAVIEPDAKLNRVTGTVGGHARGRAHVGRARQAAEKS
jgi:hypothetical protein